MSNRHISSNIRLVFDLLDYSDNINTDALIVFLDFYKAFDTVEHYFLFKALKIFDFGQILYLQLKCFIKNIDSSVILYPNTTKRFSVMRSVHQGCPISPFLFLLVVELLSLHIRNSHIIKGLSIFGKEIRVTQLADDTALFLSDKHQIENAIILIDQFSASSGNKSKCEILCLYQTEENLFQYTC